MKVFYVDALIYAKLQEYPLIAACYPQRILLRAKTKKGAISEALRIQKRQDDAAWELIERLKAEGCDYTPAYEFGPCYANWVYCFDTDNKATFHVIREYKRFN